MLPDLDQYETEQLFITVRGITGCGDILESTSNGFIIDSTPPSVNIIGTGNQALEDINIDNQIYQTENTFSSVWEVLGEANDLIDMKYSIGTFPGGNDLVNETVVDVNYIRNEITAPEGVSTYVTVIVDDEVGLEGVAYSEPVVLDTSLPTAGTVCTVCICLCYHCLV